MITSITPTKFSLKTDKGEATITNVYGKGWRLRDDKVKYTVQDALSGIARAEDIYYSLEDLEKHHPQWFGVSLLADPNLEYSAGKVIH